MKKLIVIIGIIFLNSFIGFSQTTEKTDTVNPLKKDNGIKVSILLITLGASLEIEPINKYYIEIGGTTLFLFLSTIYLDNKYSIFQAKKTNIKVGANLMYTYFNLFGIDHYIILSPLIELQYRKFGLQFSYSLVGITGYETFPNKILPEHLPLVKLSYKFNF